MCRVKIARKTLDWLFFSHRCLVKSPLVMKIVQKPLIPNPPQKIPKNVEIFWPGARNSVGCFCMRFRSVFDEFKRKRLFPTLFEEQTTGGVKNTFAKAG